MKILEVKDLRKIYGKGETLVKALDGISFLVEKGEFLAVVGTSGSGKSTLLHMMGGLDIPTSGKVLIDGKDLSLMKEEELTIFRRRNIGFVFQSYNLVPMLNVMENITLPLGLDGKKPDREYLEKCDRYAGVWKRRETVFPASFPEDSSRGWPLPGLWRQSRPSCWQTSPRGTWTAGPARTC